MFHDRSASYNYTKHKASWESVIKHHVFEVQKFEYDKQKMWKKCCFNIIFKNIIIKLKNKEIRFDLFKKIFTFSFFNPIFSSIFAYKIIIKKIIQIYSSIKYV